MININISTLDKLGFHSINEKVVNIITSKQCNHIDINFRRVIFIEKSVIGSLVRLWVLAQEQNITLRFINVNNDCMDKFRLLKLDTIIEINEKKQSLV